MQDRFTPSPMRPRPAPISLGLVLSLWLAMAGTVSAQTGSAAPANKASAPATRAVPRLMTSQERRDNADATAASSLRDERPVAPQLSIPLGRNTAQPPTANPALPRRTAAVPAAGGGRINDGAARCEALAAEEDRRACRNTPLAPPVPAR